MYAVFDEFCQWEARFSPRRVNKNQFVIAPAKKGSPSLRERGTVFTGRGRMSGELIQRVIAVLGKNINLCFSLIPQ